MEFKFVTTFPVRQKKSSGLSWQHINSLSWQEINSLSWFDIVKGVKFIIDYASMFRKRIIFDTKFEKRIIFDTKFGFGGDK
jgi:hypothetical protein